MSLPNFIIAGAPKAGTTSFFKWLAAHPSVVTSRVKETYYLMDPGYPLSNESSNYLIDGIEGYSRLFPNYEPGQLCIEATPDYMYQQAALNVLSELTTRPIIIFILRNPVERVLSLFEFARNNIGSLSLNTSAREFFDLLKDGSLARDQILNCALLHSEYHIWLEAWIRSCGNSRVQILFFEDIVNDPFSLMSRICDQVGIDGQFYKNYCFKPENQSRQIRSATLLHLRNVVQRLAPSLMQSVMVKFIYRAANFAYEKSKPIYDAAFLDEMYEHFAEPNRKLELLLERELPAGWSRNADIFRKTALSH